VCRVEDEKMQGDADSTRMEREKGRWKVACVCECRGVCRVSRVFMVKVSVEFLKKKKQPLCLLLGHFDAF
jgi:hypothetical protein